MCFKKKYIYIYIYNCLVYTFLFVFCFGAAVMNLISLRGLIKYF